LAFLKSVNSYVLSHCTPTFPQYLMNAKNLICSWSVTLKLTLNLLCSCKVETSPSTFINPLLQCDNTC
jgi:hypothetical protein